MNERGEIVRILLLVQAAAGLLASVGEALLMGTPLYLAVPLIRAAVLGVLAAAAVRGRRPALVVVIAVEWLALLGTWLGVGLGLLPGFAPAFTLMALLTGVALPAAVIVLAGRLLAARPPGARPHRAHPVVAGVAR